MDVESTVSTEGQRPAGDREAVAALRELILAGEAYRASVCKIIGIGTTESQVLSYLMARGPMGQTDVARALGLTTSATTSVIDRLEKAALVQRIAHSTDRRRTTVHLADGADRRLAAARSWLTQVLQAIPAGDRDRVGRDLLALASALRSIAASAAVDAEAPATSTSEAGTTESTSGAGTTDET